MHIHCPKHCRDWIGVSGGTGVTWSYLGSSSTGLGWEVSTNCHCLSENEMDPLSITDTSNPVDTVRNDKAGGYLLAIPEAIYSHGRRTGLRFYPAISWDTSDSLTADLLILLSTGTVQFAFSGIDVKLPGLLLRYTGITSSNQCSCFILPEVFDRKVTTIFQY